MATTVLQQVTFQKDSISNVLKTFLEVKKIEKKSPNTIRFYQEKLDNFIGFCRINNLHDIQDISTHDLRNYFIGLQENHNKGGVHAFFRTVKTFLNWYEEENEFTDWKNPIKKVRVKTPNLQPLDPADINAIKAILRTCKNDFIGIRDKAIYLMMLDTGIRFSFAYN